MLDTSTTKGKVLLITLLIVLVIDVTLKGFALWRASRNKHKIWFILILIFESAGILPLIYLLWFTKDWEKED
jgi:hypothetical protein